LTRQLRGDLVRVMGVLGDDRAVQAKAAELYRSAADLDPTCSRRSSASSPTRATPRATTSFLTKFRSAATPQEEQRYLYALAAFGSPTSWHRRFRRTINGELRTQDAPFVARSLLMSVYGGRPPGTSSRPLGDDWSGSIRRLGSGGWRRRDRSRHA